MAYQEFGLGAAQKRNVKTYGRIFRELIQIFLSIQPRMAVHHGTFKFAYYVPRTFNRTVPAYRTSVQFLKRTVPTYRTRTITKKAYRTSVPYFLAKLRRTVRYTYVTYCTVILAFNYSQL